MRDWCPSLCPLCAHRRVPLGTRAAQAGDRWFMLIARRLDSAYIE